MQGEFMKNTVSTALTICFLGFGGLLYAEKDQFPYKMGCDEPFRHLNPANPIIEISNYTMSSIPDRYIPELWITLEMSDQHGAHATTKIRVRTIKPRETIKIDLEKIYPEALEYLYSQISLSDKQSFNITLRIIGFQFLGGRSIEIKNPAPWSAQYLILQTRNYDRASTCRQDDLSIFPLV